LRVFQGCDGPGFPFICNLAITDLMAGIWFIIAATVESDYAWTDLTAHMTILDQAEARNIDQNGHRWAGNSYVEKW